MAPDEIFIAVNFTVYSLLKILVVSFYTEFGPQKKFIDKKVFLYFYVGLV